MNIKIILASLIFSMMSAPLLADKGSHADSHSHKKADKVHDHAKDEKKCKSEHDKNKAKKGEHKAECHGKDHSEKNEKAHDDKGHKH